MTQGDHHFQDVESQKILSSFERNTHILPSQSLPAQIICMAFGSWALQTLKFKDKMCPFSSLVDKWCTWGGNNTVVFFSILIFTSPPPPSLYHQLASNLINPVLSIYPSLFLCIKVDGMLISIYDNAISCIFTIIKIGLSSLLKACRVGLRLPTIVKCRSFKEFLDIGLWHQCWIDLKLAFYNRSIRNCPKKKSKLRGYTKIFKENF